MPAVFLRKYGTGAGANVPLPMVKAGAVDFATSSDWTPASGDVKVSKDGGSQANIGTLPTYTNGDWVFTFSDAELQCKVLSVRIVDSATKAVEDSAFNVETYGNASAMYQADLSAANLPANVVQLGGSTQSGTDLRHFADSGYDPATGKVEGVKLVDTTTTNTDMRGTDSALTTLGTNAPAEWINSGAFANNAISADALSAAAVAKIEAALLNEGDSQALIDAIVQAIDAADIENDVLPALIRDAILNRVLAGNHDSAGTLGKVLQDIIQDTGSTLPGQIQTVKDDTENIQSRLPASLVNNRMDSTIDGTGFEGGAIVALIEACFNYAAIATVAGADPASLVRQIVDSVLASDFNTTQKGSIQTAAAAALVANHLDKLFAAAYSPASKPGDAAGLLNRLVENDGGVPRFTANALEQAPSGGGGGGEINVSVSVPASVAQDLQAENTMPITRGDTLRHQITGLGSIANRTKLWVTCKNKADDADADAIFQIEENGGLLIFAGDVEETSNLGSVTVDDEDEGDITIVLSQVRTASMSLSRSLVFDVQVLRSTGDTNTLLLPGTVTVTADVTRATS